MAGQIGAQSRMLIDTTASFDNTSFWAEFLSESVVQQIPILNSAGVRGTCTQASERNRRGNETVTGTIEFEASRGLLDWLLPAALGAVESSNVFDVAETLPNLFFLIDKGFDICLVSNAKIGTYGRYLVFCEVHKLSRRCFRPRKTRCEINLQRYATNSPGTCSGIRRDHFPLL